MNRFLHIFVICLFSMLSVPVWGQNVDSLYHRYIMLDSLQVQKLNGEIDSLKKITSIDEKKDLRQVLKSLENRKTNLEGDNKKLQEEIDKKTNSISDIQKEVEEMTVSVDRQFEEKFTWSKNYLKKRYSNMSSDTLRLLDKEVEQYKDMSDFDDYRNCINETIRLKVFYDKLSNAINRACTPREIEDMRGGLKILLDTNKRGVSRFSPEQFSELDSLDIKLSRYNNGVKELKKIVLTINNDATVKRIREGKDYSRKEECLSIIQKIMEQRITGFVPDHRDQNINQRYFEMIPFLKKLLEKYMNELQRDPIVAPTSTELIIKELREE